MFKIKKLAYLALGFMVVSQGSASLTDEERDAYASVTTADIKAMSAQFTGAGLNLADGFAANVQALAGGGAVGAVPIAVRNAIRPAGNFNAGGLTAEANTLLDLAAVNDKILAVRTNVLETDIDTVSAQVLAVPTNVLSTDIATVSGTLNTGVGALDTKVTALRNTTLGHDTFDAMHGTATGVAAALTAGINTIGGGLNDDAVTVSRAQLEILFNWSQGAGGAIVHAGAGNLNLGAATGANVTLSEFIDALVARTLG
jgi:hypothetical protein